MAVSDSLIDTLFDGRYRIVRKLGAGGMADVYLAEDQELGRRVAIKILNSRHGNDDQFIERFRREAKNAAALNHPNIVSIYDRGEAEDTYYIAMEFLDGRTLKELLARFGVGLSDMAFAAWTGLLLTFINLIPIGQLDGGHVAIALYEKVRSRGYILYPGKLTTLETFRVGCMGQLGERGIDGAVGAIGEVLAEMRAAA